MAKKRPFTGSRQARVGPGDSSKETMEITPKVSGRSSSPANRASRAVESFKSAANCIGPITPGMAVFAITRGQFSLIDAIAHVLDECGPNARISIWTWVLVDYEIEFLRGLMSDGRVSSGRLIIDASARKNNALIIDQWCQIFGKDSARFAMTHAKIATIEAGGMKVLLRGSMNLNHNPRFEQLDVSEGGPAFELVREIENEFQDSPYTKDGESIYAASKLSERFDASTMKAFKELKTWKR